MSRSATSWWLCLFVALALIVASGRVVGSARSDVYHRPPCHNARNITEANVRVWPSAAAARADGYRACRVCHPE